MTPRAHSLVSAAALLVACAEPRPEPVIEVIVSVDDGNGGRIAGAVVSFDGSPAGRTGADGVVKNRLPGPEGRRVELGVACPAGFRSEAPASRLVTVRAIRPLGSLPGENGATTERFACLPTEIGVVLLVRTNGPAGLAVTALGRKVAELDADGVAQTVIAGRPGEEVEVVIDTSPRPALRPASPSRRFGLPQASQIIVFDQVFDEARKKAVRRRGHGPRRGPRRL